MIDDIVVGVLTGTGYSLMGYAKNMKEKNEPFNYQKLLKSVIICGSVGGITSYAGLDFDAEITGGLGIAVTSIVNGTYRLGKQCYLDYKNKEEK